MKNGPILIIFQEIQKFNISSLGLEAALFPKFILNTCV